jgi:gamma-glutamyltranspeptidase/glutathione hydrolase
MAAKPHPPKPTRDMYIRSGKVDPNLSLTGALAIGVPGSLMAYDYALRHFGRLPLKEHLLAAQKSPKTVSSSANHTPSGSATFKTTSARFPEAKRFSSRAMANLTAKAKSSNSPIWPKLTVTWQKQGIDWFYKGEFARRLENWMVSNGGILSARDFADYRTILREPIRTRYRGFEILGFPPPSSGGVHVAQILNILERFDLKKYPPYSVDSIHLIAEAMKFAFADRAYWLGDPDFVRVPRGLTSGKYAESLCSPNLSRPRCRRPEHGPADQFSNSYFGKHTTHFSTADNRGNWVACTATVNTTFGSKVVIPGTGVVMNNQMDDFSAQPGTPNFFGLVGAEANAIAPGKRPLSSMSPTIVLRRGRAILSLGAAGGPTIISQTVVNLINILDYGMDIEQALAKPRIHQQWKPDELKLETIPADVQEALQKKGQNVRTVNSMGAAQIVHSHRQRLLRRRRTPSPWKAAVW